MLINKMLRKHRMFLLPEYKDIDFFKVVINPEGIVGQTIKVNRSLFEVILLSEKAIRYRYKMKIKFFCEASGLGIPKKKFCELI
ncbi:MAG: hypothetical protein Ct9H90mP6_04760 [Gammaproteobacteria bacterium]|nr:MAG: hypothetical protein Ct9H90mP6_04760 [Gammaproteobacteria bacterium]